MALKTPITTEMIKTENEEQWDRLRRDYGNIGFGGPLPWDERWRAGKVMHGLYVLMGWDGNGSANRLLSGYGIPEDVREELIERYCTEEEDAAAPPAPKIKLADKYKELDQWAFDHPVEQVTPESLVEISGLSYASVMKYLKTTPRYKKVKNGLYEAFEDQQRVL